MNSKIPSGVMIGALSSLIALANSAQAAELVKCAEQERCYGIVKAGKNDCGTSSSACVGTVKQDNQRDAWVYVPKGTCAKIAGGTTVVPASKK